MALLHRSDRVVPESPFWLRDWWREFVDSAWDTNGWLRLEEFHEDDTHVVRLELPDVDPDKDVELTVTEGVLHIRAQRSERSEKKEKTSYRSEFRYGELTRNIALPDGVGADDVKASYRDGILELRIPCPAEQAEAEPTAKKIPISRS